MHAQSENILCVYILFQTLLVQAIFSRNAEEVKFLLHKNEEVNALVRGLATHEHDPVRINFLHILLNGPAS